jgi:protein SCO1/2
VKRLIVSVVAMASLALVGCSSSGGAPSDKASGLNDNTGSSGQFEGIGLTPAQARPTFTLTDTTGKTFNFGTDTVNAPTLLFFGYTTCPDICPETMADIGLAMKKLPVATQKKVDVVFVSTDVKHDTGPIIAQWLRNFSTGSAAHFIGLHGTQAQVNAAQAAAHVFLAEDGGETHSTEVLLFGADNYARDSFVFNNNGEQNQIAHDVPLVLHG